VADTAKGLTGLGARLGLPPALRGGSDEPPAAEITVVPAGGRIPKPLFAASARSAAVGLCGFSSWIDVFFILRLIGISPVFKSAPQYPQYVFFCLLEPPQFKHFIFVFPPIIILNLPHVNSNIFITLFQYIFAFFLYFVGTT
jgi:hypothetical protein